MPLWYGKCSIYVPFWSWTLSNDTFSLLKSEKRWINFLSSKSFEKIPSQLVSSFLIISYRSFFDVLCEIFIFKSTFRLISNLITPFLECETRKKARHYLLRLRKKHAISPRLYHAIFKKGLLSAIPERYRFFLVPEN